MPKDEKIVDLTEIRDEARRARASDFLRRLLGVEKSPDSRQTIADMLSVLNKQRREEGKETGDGK